MYFRQNSKYASASGIFSGNSCTVFIFALIIHYFGLISNNLYYWFVLASFILACLGLGLAILTLLDLWRYGYRGGLRALRSIIYSLAICFLVIFGYYSFFTGNAINDVSTDINNVPAFLVGCSAANYTNKIFPATSLASRYDVSKENVVQAIRNLCAKKNWTIIKETEDSQNYYIEIAKKTLWGGFTTHLVARIHKEDHHSVFVDARARSCDLKNDAGLSDKFINKFMKHLEEIMIIGDIN